VGALGTHAVPTINPSAAAPARVMMLVSLNPFPPMKGTVIPRFRAWISSRVPSRASALTTIACGPAAFACPADSEIFPEVGSSYDWRDTPNPITTLAGRSVSAVSRSTAVLAFDTLPGWHEKHFMNAIRVDGSAEEMREEDCLGDLRVPVAP